MKIRILHTCTGRIPFDKNSSAFETGKTVIFFSLMIDGSTDHGVIEEAIMYVCYLDKSVGRPLTVFLGIEEPKAGTGRGFFRGDRFVLSKSHKPQFRHLEGEDYRVRN